MWRPERYIYLAGDPLRSYVDEPGHNINLARDPLRSYFDEPQKHEIRFYIDFVHYLRKFNLNQTNKRRRKDIIRRVLVIICTFNSRHHDIERYVGQSTIEFI